MTFRRTTAGLSNMHLFVKADAVVFVEGGARSFTREEIYGGQYNRFSLDICFWRSLFGLYLPERKYHFRAVGSKASLLEIERDVRSGQLSNTYVAMDCDYDRLLRKRRVRKGVFFTYGYSWENDVWRPGVTSAAFNSLCGACDAEDNVERLIRSNFRAFYESIARFVRLDFLLFQNDITFIKRGRPERLLTMVEAGPVLNKKQLHIRIQEAKTARRGRIYQRARIRIDAARDCYGHLVAEFGYRTLVYLIKKLSGLPNIAKQYANTMSIEKFVGTLRGGGDRQIATHYSRQFDLIA